MGIVPSEGLTPQQLLRTNTPVGTLVMISCDLSLVSPGLCFLRGLLAWGAPAPELGFVRFLLKGAFGGDRDKTLAGGS